MDQSDVAEVQKIKSLIVEQGTVFKDMRDRIDADLTRLSKDFADAQLAAQRPNGRDTGGAAQRATEPIWYDAKSKSPVHVLAPNDKLVTLERASDPIPSVGRFLRGLAMGSRADDAA